MQIPEVMHIPVPKREEDNAYLTTSAPCYHGHPRVLQIPGVFHVPVLEREEDSAYLTHQASYMHDPQKVLHFPTPHRNMTSSPLPPSPPALVTLLALPNSDLRFKAKPLLLC
ncbi:hypothetical protein AMTR_s00145p00100720 [Amborella trichopoda]|uniref:Uncharacterized protein n=1 Tax=Amborella trichopoda TaxID=13333 RepID=W1P7V3_AMBTC|nr:hypothetical protein AMTR_s00145p00100720 [Amborella trichopoda]